MTATDLGRAGGLPPAPKDPALPSRSRSALEEGEASEVEPTTPRIPAGEALATDRRTQETAGGGSRSSLDGAPPAGPNLCPSCGTPVHLLTGGCRCSA